MLIDDDVSFHITLNFRPPEIPPRFDDKFTGFPIFSVEEFAVYKYCEFMTFHRKVGPPEYFFVILTVPVSTFPKSFRQGNLHFRICTTNGSHVPRALLFCM